MSQADSQPPAPEDRTILVPSPGGRRAAGAAATASPVAFEQGIGAVPDSLSSARFDPGALLGGPAKLHGRGINPLVRAANPLLDLVVPLRVMATHQNLEGLRQQLVIAIKQFEADARAVQIDLETIAAARYALCTFLDETISSTPWGGSGVWASRSLLVAFHNEAFGGEKFFLILQRLCQNVRANLDVLELMYLCLALGLEGRYRVIEGGQGQLDTLRERLQQLIGRERGPYETELSLHWHGSSERRAGLRRLVPLWIIGGLLALVLLGVHLGFSFSLNRASDPVYLALHRIYVTGPQPVQAPLADPPVRVAKFLASDIERGLLSVTETADRSTVVLHGDGVFASGGADVVDAFEPLLARIGGALKTVPGKVIVIGHTDDVQINSARYPSNWALSKARAQSVVDLLAAQAGPVLRYVVEGRGETEPLVPNDSVANRARNRRVVIIVLTPSAGQEKP